MLEDIRLTDHDVILARTDLATSQLRLTNVQEENFDVALSLPGVDLSVPRGWNSVDVKIRGKEFRLINTHLEVAGFPQVQAAQAAELFNKAAATDLPVVMLGDFNTSAVAGQPNDTPTYELLVGAGFEDTWNLTQIGERFTCCQASDLRNDGTLLDSRIDFVFTRGAINTVETDVVGEAQADRTIPFPTAPAGLWPSDHAGVVASLVIPSRQQVDPSIPFVASTSFAVSDSARGSDEEPTSFEGIRNRASWISLTRRDHANGDVVGRKQEENFTSTADQVFAAYSPDELTVGLSGLWANPLAAPAKMLSR